MGANFMLLLPGTVGAVHLGLDAIDCRSHSYWNYRVSVLMQERRMSIRYSRMLVRKVRNRRDRNTPINPVPAKSITNSDVE